MKRIDTGNLIGKTSRLLSKELSKDLSISKLEITTEQWILLQVLTSGTKTQKELGEITLKTKATINSLISYLLKSGYIIKRASNTDKRITEITISKKGLQIYKQANISAHKIIYKATNGLSEKEIQELNSYLIRMQNNLLK